MSHRGTSLGSASPTRTCRLASLLHICTYHFRSYEPNKLYLVAISLWIINLDLVLRREKSMTSVSRNHLYVSLICFWIKLLHDLPISETWMHMQPANGESD